MLIQSQEWANLKRNVSDFEHFESQFSNVGKEIDRQKYRIIKTLESYNFQFPNLSNSIERINKNNIKPNETPESEKFYISFDLVKANYQTLLYLDSKNLNLRNKAVTEHDAERILFPLPKTWEIFCNDLEIHFSITNSKSLRQEILGHINPKATSRIQSNVLVEFIKQNNLENVVFLSTDEVIIEVTRDELLKNNWPTSFVFTYDSFDWKFKKSIFTYTDKGHKQFFDLQRMIGESFSIVPSYIKLFKVPKKYYIYEFVKRVLKQPLHILDTYFVEDNYLQQICEEISQ